MKSFRCPPCALVLSVVALASVSLAQDPKTATPPPAQGAQPAAQEDSAAAETALFVSKVRNVLVPVTVLDRGGAVVDGIETGRFHLYDNGHPQKINVDVSVQPISLVIAIQQSDRMEAVLNQIHKIGPMIEPMVTGENGEAAVISYDSRIQKKQDFTSDTDLLTKAIANIHAGNSQARMIDAIEEGIQMLKGRQASRRRIILLIGETRDVGSEARIRETLISEQLNNVTLYTVDVSRIVTALTDKGQPPRTNPIDPAAYNLPGGSVNTPTSIAQASQIGNRVEFVPMLKDIYLGVKRIFVENPAQVFTEGTGGAQFTFKKERGLEDAIASLGREIHSQYLITYPPDDLNEDGFHEIRVDVDMPDLVVRTRPGYYLASVGGAK